MPPRRKIRLFAEASIGGERAIARRLAHDDT